MAINYLGEHKSCVYYTKNITFGFLYLSESKGVGSHYPKEKCNLIVFLLKGKSRIRCNEFDLILQTGEMVFIHRNSEVKYENIEDCEYVLAMFESITQLCVKTALTDLIEYKKRTNYEVKPFPIKEALLRFFDPLTYYLKDGASCKHLHDIKIQELFWIFRAYYTREELASFLYTIIGASHDFRYKVLDNYGRVTTVQELANLCGMSVVTFKRQFVEEFGEVPSVWLQKRMVELISFRLADQSVPLKQIIDELNFSSLPNFVRYCKKYYGESPGKIRKKMTTKNE